MNVIDTPDTLEPYRQNSPADGIDTTAVLARAEVFAVEAERLHKDRLYPAAQSAANVAQAWAAIAIAARTGTTERNRIGVA